MVRTYCSKCIYDSSVPSIEFDQDGICNYCHQVDFLIRKYGSGSAIGEERFKTIVDQIRRDGEGKKYDCIIGVSGGTDSSFMIDLASRYGLRPLAVHYDNTWNTGTATTNIHRMLDGTGVDLETFVLNNKEADDIFRAFFLAGVPELDASTDLAYAYVLRKVAVRFSIGYILEGHSFIEEGISPLGNNYFDGKYIRSIHREFGSIPMQNYPLMTLGRFLKSALLDRVMFVRPLWYIAYSKSEAKSMLRSNYGWEDYGGHHLENRLTAFLHSFYLPVKFKTDMRNNTIAARVRNKEISRDEGIAAFESPPEVDTYLIEYFQQRLDISTEFFSKVMLEKPRDWRQFPSYKKTFEKLAPVFRILAEKELVPMSFYIKYCERRGDT